MRGIFLDGKRIGTVMKIMGEPLHSRWWAYASDDRKMGFPRMKDAVAWLETLAEADKAAAS